MNTSIASLVLLGGAYVLAPVANAATTLIFNDTFDSNQASNYLRWNADGTTDMTLNGAGGNLTVTPGGANNGDRTFVRTFDPVTLANEGDAIRFSVDFYVTNSGNPLRFGLYNIGGAITDGSLASTSVNKDGYFTFFYHNATSNSTLRREYIGGTNAIMTGGATGTTPATRPFVTQLASDSETFNFQGSANVATMVLTVTKGANGNNLLESAIYRNGQITSYSMSATETDGYGLSTFNTISFLTLANQTIYDNIKVEFITTSNIPEPSSFAALAGAAAVVTAGLRRRRRIG